MSPCAKQIWVAWFASEFMVLLSPGFIHIHVITKDHLNVHGLNCHLRIYIYSEGDVINGGHVHTYSNTIAARVHIN